MSTSRDLPKAEEQQPSESPKTPENSLSAREKGGVAKEGRRHGKLAVKRALVVASDSGGSALKRAATSDRLLTPIKLDLPSEEEARREEEAKRKVEEAVLDYEVTTSAFTFDDHYQLFVLLCIGWAIFTPNSQ